MVVGHWSEFGCKTVRFFAVLFCEKSEICQFFVLQIVSNFPCSFKIFCLTLKNMRNINSNGDHLFPDFLFLLFAFIGSVNAFSILRPFFIRPCIVL